MMSFRYPQPTREDLPRLARLAYDVSAQHCEVCRDYHVMWPYLRSLGCNGGGPEYCWPIQRAVTAAAIAGRSTVRWLLAGSADAGQLGLVGETIAAHPDMAHFVAVVDRCETPLGLCRAHALAVGLPLSTVRSELADFDGDGQFDVVLLHHIIGHFPKEQRVPLIARAGGWLAPGGRMLLAVSYHVPGKPGAGMSGALRVWREAVIRSEAASGRLELPEDIETFVARLDRMRETRKRAAGSGPGDLDSYRRLIAGAGLSIREIVDLPFDDDERALHGGNPKPRCIIVAERQAPTASLTRS